MSGEELPKGWAKTTLGAVTLEKVPQSTPSSAFTYVDISSVDNASKMVVDPKSLTAEEAPSRARQPLKANDVIVSLTRPNLNAVALVPHALDGAIGSTGFYVLRPSACEPGFLFALVKGGRFVQEMTDVVKGALYPAINAEHVRAFEFGLPPLPEQKRIVARLDALQARSRAAREALAEVPALLDTLRQSLLAAAFRGDLTAEWRAKNPDVEPASKLLERIRAERKRRWEQANPKKKYVEPEPVDDSELPELPEGWCWASFETLVDGVRSGTPRTAVREDTGFRVLRSSAVRPGVVDFDDYSFLPTAPSSEEVVMAGDLLVTRLSGTLSYVGNGALVRTAPSPPMAYPDRIFRSRPVDPRVGQWIEHALGVALLRRGLERTAKSSAGHQRISQGDLLEFPVPLPPIEEQREVQRVLPQALSMVSGLLSALSSAQADLDTLDQSILARAFRGELVDQDPNDEPAEVLLARIRSEGDAPASRGRARRSG